MGDASQGSYDPTFDVRRSPSTHMDKTASPSGRRLSEIHIPSPDHSVSISSSEQFDKAGLVAAQEAALHDAAVLEMGWTGGKSEEYAFMPEGEKPRSPAVGSLQDLKSLRPIRLRNMKVGKVHRGRILSGTLCCKSVKIFAVMNVLEEEGTGDATKFVISNAVPRSATTATAQRLYPEGAQLSVREPYLKRFADGMVGILVENPNDIIFNYLPDEIPSPVSERENLLWPVYKDPTGDGPDTPVFNTYGSFLSSPSLLSRNSLNSPLTPGSPRSFLDDPLDGLTIRTIRKFKSFRKQEQGPDNAKDTSLKPPSGDEDLSSAVENVAERPSEGSLDKPNSTQASDDLSAGNLEIGCKAEESSKTMIDEGLEIRLGQIGETDGAVPIGDACGTESGSPSSPTGGLISESSCPSTNLKGFSESESNRPDSLRVSDVSPEDVNNSESAEEVRVGSGDILNKSVPLCTEIESRDNDSTDQEEILESAGCSDSFIGGSLGSQTVVDVGESPGGQAAVLIGSNEETSHMAVTGSDNFQADGGISCKLPLADVAGDCVETVADTSVEESRRRNSSAGGILGASGVEGGVDLSTSLKSSPSAADDEISEHGIQVGAQSPEACNGSAVKPDIAEAELENSQRVVGDSAQSIPSACEKGNLTKGVHVDDGVDASFAELQTGNWPRGLESAKVVCEPVASIDKSKHSTANGCGPAAGESSEENVDLKGLQSSEIIVEEELSAAALRMKGNQRFTRQDLTGAVELYTRAIHKAVQESKEQIASIKSNGARHVNGNGVETEMEVVMDYSNRAEAWLRLHHYERAWSDAERALCIDPNHLKSLFRKGRALLGLGDYQQALTHLESAYARAPFDKDLLAAIKLSRIGDRQSRLGFYELTDYYVRGRFAGEVPTCADYVGPIQVKAANGDKGRGLFLTKHVEVGDLLLVSNPLAMLDSTSANRHRKSSLDSDAQGRLDPKVQEELVLAVRERAKVSTKNRQRLLALCYGDEGHEQQVPSMDLFIPGRRVAPAENLNLNEERIIRLVVRNAIDRNMVSTSMEKRHDPNRGDSENHEERVFWGLWLLPSFINHSCVPNVSMVVIGRALFLYASRDLSAGEELVCSYFNVFQPLPQRREIASRCWGFTCKCARCSLEIRFESSLKKLYALHSRLEPNPEFVLQFSPYAYKTPAKDLAKELEVIEKSKKLDHRERCWLQASFTQLYTCSRDFMGPHGNYPYLEAALHAMQIVCPGSNSTLDVGLLVREMALKESNGKKTSQYKAVNQQVLRICQCIYGKQKASVLQALVDGN